IPIADLRRILSEHGVIVRDRDPKEAPLYTMAEIPMPLRRRLWLNGMIRLVIFFVVLPTLMFIPITTAVVIAVVCMLMGLHLDRDQFGWLLLGTLAAWSGMLYFADCRYRALKRYSACLGRWLPTSVEEAVEQRLTAGGRDQEEVAERVDRHQS
ncbi:MAG TPA: hypothetical protein VGY58_10565, partial [Gemmataceae bacterium]|nr:hypothetical protein [Gemmataceae bacterium]